MGERELTTIDADNDYEVVRAEPRPSKKGKVVLMTLSDLDGRTMAAQRARKLITEIEESIGGDLTIEQKLLVIDVAVLNSMTEDLSARLYQGEKIDRLELATLTNAKRRALDAISK